jgi:tripartite-type tricarboxylate transporter receptor subunit TctC
VGRLNGSPSGGITTAMDYLLNFIDVTHVPYKGGRRRDRSLGGQLQAMFLPVRRPCRRCAAAASMLAVTRLLAEEGVRDIDVDIWYALFAPAGLPRELVNLLNAEMAAILAQAEVRDNLQKQGLNPVTGTPEELARLVETDLERWARVVRTARISAD